MKRTIDVEYSDCVHLDSTCRDHSWQSKGMRWVRPAETKVKATSICPSVARKLGFTRKHGTARITVEILT